MRSVDSGHFSDMIVEVATMSVSSALLFTTSPISKRKQNVYGEETVVRHSRGFEVLLSRST